MFAAHPHPQPRTPGPTTPRLPPRLIRRAIRSGRDRRRHRAQRRDGWTPARIRIFLDILAKTGSVSRAASAAGMSRQSAYALRASAKGRAFDDAWRSALALSAPEIPDDLMAAALHGSVEPIYRNGKLWGHRYYFDNRLAMRVLRRLDRLATSKSPAARLLQSVAEEFDTFVAIVASGDEEAADAFLRSRATRPVAKVSTLSTLPGAESADAEISNLSTLPDPSTRRTGRSFRTREETLSPPDLYSPGTRRAGAAGCTAAPQPPLISMRRRFHR